MTHQLVYRSTDQERALRLAGQDPMTQVGPPVKKKTPNTQIAAAQPPDPAGGGDMGMSMSPEEAQAAWKKMAGMATPEMKAMMAKIVGQVAAKKK